jgi:uncharacterized protein (UPF0548 family)
MFSFRKPSVESIRSFLQEQSSLGFSYSQVGQTAQSAPIGFNVDHTRVKIGNGECAFLAANAALRRWDHFRLGWVEAWPKETPIRTGEVVSVLARIGAIWSLNACRIVYVIDQTGPTQRFGFAYGTLPDHVEAGEERFLIEWDRSDDSVNYDILAFSRPRHPFVQLGYPFARLCQRRFARQSAAAMLRIVSG